MQQGVAKKFKKKKKEPECLPWEELWLLRCQLGLNFDTATLGSVPLGKLLNIPEHQFSLQSKGENITYQAGYVDLPQVWEIEGIP